MCGIVGLFAKSAEIEESLGEHLAAMLAQMNDRGPDSAGVAVYRDPAPSGASKLTLYSADDDFHGLDGAEVREIRARHAVVIVDEEPFAAEEWVRERRP